MTPDTWEGLSKLRLHFLAEHYDTFIKAATKDRLGPEGMIELVVKEELNERRRRSTESRLNKAKIGKYHPMADFDWNWPKEIPRATIERLFDLSFIAEPSNIVLVGTSGLGKTMIAKNLAHEAALAGYTTLFIEVAEALADLEQQDSPSAFRRRLARYTKPQLLVLDEVGYLSYRSSSADLLFQIITRRYENAATIVTTNKAFKDWGDMFPGAGCVTPLIDRLTHYAEIVLIKGDSYRTREAKEKASQRSKK